jgi:hypothetical protein
MNARVAVLEDQVLSNVRHLRSLGYNSLQIAEQLGLHKETEIRAVAEACSGKGMRKWQRGPESHGQARRRGGTYTP